MEYYYQDGGRQQGPFSLEQLRRKPLRPETPIWHDGLRHWTMAIAIPELIDLFLDLSQPAPEAAPAAAAGAPPAFTHTDRAKEPVRPFPPKKRHALPKGSVIVKSAAIAAILGLLSWGVYRGAQQHVQTVASGGTDTSAIAAQQREEQEQQRLKLEEERRQARLKAMRNNWSRYFRLERNDYDVIPFVGGIRPFEVTVTNTSDFPAEALTVRITYIKSDGGVYKTETVSFANIPAHASRTRDAPGSWRGASISRKITRVRSAQLNLCYPAGSGKVGDPFYCE